MANNKIRFAQMSSMTTLPGRIGASWPGPSPGP